MSALNAPKKISKRHELRQDTVVTFYARAWDFFEKNRKLVYGILAALAAVVIVAIGITIYLRAQQQEAQQLLSGIVGVYERGDYRTALDGTDDQRGLLSIAGEYGATNAGNMAAYYAADALFRLGEYDQALEYFQKYDADDNLIGASALAGQAAIYEGREEFEQAGTLYERAANLVQSDLVSPQYLLDAGRAYEKAGSLDKARNAYSKIQEDYPDSPTAGGIDFYLARVDALEVGVQ